MPGCLPPRVSNLLPTHPEHWGGQALSPVHRRWFPRGFGTQQKCDRRPQVSHTNSPRRRKSHSKSHPTNRVGSPSWQGRHVDGQFWHERRWFNLPRVVQKFAWKLLHHYRPINNNQIGRKYPRGCHQRDYRYELTKGTFHPGPWYRPCIYCGDRSNPDLKPPRRWRDDVAPYPTAISLFTPSIRSWHPALTSTALPQRQERRRQTSKKERSTRRLPHGRQWQALQS